jgi:hypothetical protein
MIGVHCALPVSVAATATQHGTLTVCNGATASGTCGGSSSGGSGSGSTAIPFTVDTTKSEATIDVP